MNSAGFPYRFDRLKPRASKFRGPPAKVYNIFNTVIGLSHLCCHSVLYFQNNPSVIFLAQLQKDNYIKVFESMNTKETKGQNQPWSPMPEGGEP
jgi:hypothetical protein